MGLWPTEWDEHRVEARSMMEAVVAGLPKRPPPLDDPAEQIRVARERNTILESFSELGVDTDRAGVPCREFRPDVPPVGVYLDIHGGGMTMGTPRMNDLRNEHLSRDLGVAVVSIDYRLAPEHPFPAGSDDCLAVAGWLVEHAVGEYGTDRLAIGGESAGAYFAALTMLRVRDELGAADRFSGINLVFGVYDLSGTPSQRGVRASDAPDFLSPEEPKSIREHYAPGRDPEALRDPRLSPLFADLHELPPALFTVGTADHVCDDTLFMAARWQAAGNDAELCVYPDCGHGFIILPTAFGRQALERIDRFIVETLK